MIPGAIALGIALLLVWKGWRKFQNYERRKESRAPRRVREIMRREGESVASENSDDSNGNDGGGSRLKPAKKNLRVRFYDDHLHSDAHLTVQEWREADDYIQQQLHLHPLR